MFWFWKQSTNEYEPTQVDEYLWVSEEYEVQIWFHESSNAPVDVWIDLRQDAEWNRIIDCPASVLKIRLPFQDGGDQIRDYIITPRQLNIFHLEPSEMMVHFGF